MTTKKTKNPGPKPVGFRYGKNVINRALTLVNDKGLTYRAAAEKVRAEFNVGVSHKTIFEWTQKF